jgi:dTMP kinase
MVSIGGRMVRGIFVVFEGIDGSGTTTQASLLHSSLINNGIRASLTSEPTNGPIGNLIRQIIGKRLHVSANQTTVDLELAYLFAADRFDHIYNDVDGILKRLSGGYVVISTRYYLSSYAYNAPTDEDFELIRRLNQGFPKADLTFYLECPINEALRRIAIAGRPPDQNENEYTLVRVQQNYERALAECNERLFRFNALSSKEQLHQDILSIVWQRFRGGEDAIRMEEGKQA